MEIEKHERQFRGWWVPVEIVDLFEQQIINAIEVLLLATIDSLVRNGQGCFASNAYLAKKLHLSEHRVSLIITKLKRLGLLKQVSFDGRKRVLITCWSESYKEPHKIEPGQKRPGCRAQKGQAAEPKRASILYKVTNQGNNLNSYQNSNGRSGAHTRGLILNSEAINKHAAKMLKVLTAHKCNTVPYKDSRGNVRNKPITVEMLAKRFEVLHLDSNVDTGQIDDVLDWLKDNYGKTYTPKIYKLDDLVTKWRKFEDAMSRERSEGDNELPSQLNSKVATIAIAKIRGWFEEQGINTFSDWIDPADIEKARKALGIKAGTFDPREV